MAGLLVAAAIAAAMPAAVPATAAPTGSEPAIFVVRAADTTVYIFGTFHALSGKSEWFKSGVRNAFESSDELILETLIPEQPTAATAAMTQPHPSALRGFPVAPSASFLASTRMAISAGRSQGMQVDNGADLVLRRAAEAEGKPVEGLETLDSQLSMFNRLPPPPAAPAAPRQDQNAAPAMNTLSKSMSEMQSAWKRGDQMVFVRVLGQLEQASPATYRMMFTERNARWADWIRARMQTPGTVFVAVGAGHLAGKDSVLVKLAQLGIPSARVY